MAGVVLPFSPSPLSTSSINQYLLLMIRKAWKAKHQIHVYYMLNFYDYFDGTYHPTLYSQSSSLKFNSWNYLLNFLQNKISSDLTILNLCFCSKTQYVWLFSGISSYWIWAQLSNLTLENANLLPSWKSLWVWHWTK